NREAEDSKNHDSHLLIVYPQISPITRFGITTDLLVIYSSASHKETQKQSRSLCATHRAQNLLDLRSQGSDRLRSCGSLWRPTISALRMQIGFKPQESNPKISPIEQI